MGAPKLQPRHTVDEYLAMERATEERHIYLDGEIIAMAGESDEHGDIGINVVTSLATQLKGKPCRVRSQQAKIRSGPVPLPGSSKKGFFSYPDILVICGEIEHHDAHRDVILNPKVIIEILSDSTEAFDRGGKFERYQKYNPTLSDYILISQDQPQVEHYRRKTNGEWSYRMYSGLKATVGIMSIRCKLRLKDIYDRVKFAAE